MSQTVLYKKFNLIPVTTTWFNTDAGFKQPKFHGLYILRQSVPLLNVNEAICIQQYTSTTSIIDLKKSEEELWKALDPKSCRYEIRKIKKIVDAGENIQISNKCDIKAFLDVGNRYIKEKGYSKPLSEWQLNMYLEKGNGEMFNLYYNGKLIGSNFYIKDYPGRVRVLYSFNDRFSDESIAKLSGSFMRYLHWHAMIKQYKKEGFIGYDMGGVGTKTEATRGIAEFKLSFGGPLVEEQNYVFVSNPLIGKLYKTYRSISARRYKKG